MTSRLRTFALTIGALYIAACSNDKPLTKDVLAEDSTLALDVMSAGADSITIQPADTTSPSAADTPVATPSTSVATGPVASPSIALNTAPAQAEPDTRVRSTTRRSPILRSAVARRSAPTRKSARISSRRVERSVPAKSETQVASVGVSKPAATISEPARTIETTPLKSSAMLPAGTELSLAADQRICASMSRVGDTFAVRTANDVVGPIGVVIPKGTVALAQIASTNKNFDVDMKSISFAGHTYVVTSDVTYTELEKVRRKTSVSKTKVAGGAAIGAVAGAVLGGNPGTTAIGAAAGGIAGAALGRPRAYQDRCVPNGGRIDIKLTEPLKLALSE